MRILCCTMFMCVRSCQSQVFALLQVPAAMYPWRDLMFCFVCVRIVIACNIDA